MNAMTTVRVRIAETVTIDVDAWALTYGTEVSADAVREDVKRHAHELLADRYSRNDEIGGAK